MDDARGVGGLQPLEELEGHLVGIGGAQLAARLDAAAQILAVHELHDHEPVAVRQVAEVEHLADVLGADAAGGLGLALEPLDGVLVLGDAGVQHLDGHLAVDPDVLPS